MKTKKIITTLLLIAGSSWAGEYHVAKDGNDTHGGSAAKPFLTIQHAANLAQPGDTITVHEGTYRERVNPPRGGLSDAQRIVYQAAPGESVVIKGSEVVTGWEKVKANVWTVVLPNSFFGDFNPFDDLISGDWFKDKGRDHHTGAVYLDGHWLREAAKKDDLFNAKPTKKSSSGYLFKLAWMRMVGADEQISPADLSNIEGVRVVPSNEGGKCIGFISDGGWVSYAAVDFGSNTEHMEFRVSSEKDGGLIEIRLGSPTGDLLATCTVPETGGWKAWRTVKTPIIPSAGKKNVCLVFKAKPAKNPAAGNNAQWFAEVGDENTTIWTQFKGDDLNQRHVEVNVRQSVFYPAEPGRDYITVRGFTLENAATPWAPPTAEQIGLIGTHWSKGWIIENNTIRHSACVGVTLGKYGDEWDNKAGSADGYNGTIKRAIANGWNKATIGSHVVRNNHILQCEQAGIVGSLGAVFSTIHNNEIHEIYINKKFAGYEIAGIKFHASIDCVISQNHIYRCGGSGGGIWLDWMAQGTRVSGNLMHHNSIDLFMEVNHGPFLIDHNIFLSSNFLRDWSQGGAYAHNLIGGKMQVRPQSRKTPLHEAHSTELKGLSNISCGDDQFINNIFINGITLQAYDSFSDSVTQDGNVFLAAKARLISKADGSYLELEYDASGFSGEQRPLVTSQFLGRTTVSNLPFEQPDGSPYRLDADYFGQQRNSKTPGVGPFETSALQRHKVWPLKKN